MLHKTEGIVLSILRYSDRYAITRVYTADFGATSYLLPMTSSKKAKIIYETLEVDNENFLSSKLSENTITYETDNDSLKTTLATIDDLIACEILAEKITTIKKDH